MRLTQTTQFKKDLKKQIKRGKDPEKVLAVVKILTEGKDLPESYKDHPLRGRPEKSVSPRFHDFWDFK